MVDGWMGDDWLHNGAFRQPNFGYVTNMAVDAGDDDDGASGAGADRLLRPSSPQARLATTRRSPASKALPFVQELFQGSGPRTTFSVGTGRRQMVQGQGPLTGSQPCWSYGQRWAPGRRLWRTRCLPRPWNRRTRTTTSSTLVIGPWRLSRRRTTVQTGSWGHRSARRHRARFPQDAT